MDTKIPKKKGTRKISKRHENYQKEDKDTRGHAEIYQKGTRKLSMGHERYQREAKGSRGTQKVLKRETR